DPTSAGRARALRHPACRPLEPTPRSCQSTRGRAKSLGMLTLRLGTSNLALRPGTDYVIGRAHDCTISLEDNRVSRNHARISVDARGGATVEDLGSRNGTLLNEEPLP